MLQNVESYGSATELAIIQVLTASLVRCVAPLKFSILKLRNNLCFRVKENPGHLEQ
jgi:hypothetical protein